MNVFLAKLRRRFEQDRGVPLMQRVRENGAAAMRYAAHAANAKVTLRSCNSVGAWARTAGGQPFIDNQGEIHIGSHVLLTSTFSPVQLSTARGGEIAIGARTIINFGTMVSSHAKVTIGSEVSIGPYCILCDHTTTAPSPKDLDAAPIVIGDGVWLAGRVTLLPGARVGARSVITAGSIVEGEIPPGVVAGGNPARVLRRLGTDKAASQHLLEEEQLTAEGAALLNEQIAPERREQDADEPKEITIPPPAQRGKANHRALVISDFTADSLAQQLTDDIDQPWIDGDVAPFDQVVPTLMRMASGELEADVAVVWTRAQSAIPSMQRVLGFEQITEAELCAEVDVFVEHLKRGLASTKCAIVPTWTLPSYNRGWGTSDSRNGITHALNLINARLMTGLRDVPNVHVLNAQRWVEVVGRHAQSPKLWYMGKVAFHDDVFAEAVKDIKAALLGSTGGARKLIVVDLDDTLWGGIVGDDGWENLRLGGHDGLGESFHDFQALLKNLKNRGIILAIASKNEESVALDAIRSHPDMVLREDDFAAWRINWSDKAANIAEIAAELNLGLQSVVFIDDNPVERGRVREQLPEVFVPEWPEDKLLYTSALLGLRCFDTPQLTQEDKNRAAMYLAERKRAVPSPQAVGSLEDWVRSLKLQVSASPLNSGNAARAAQLLNKTNQLNLTTRRLTQSELMMWAAHHDREVITVQVGDRYGDSGLTGVVSVQSRGDTAQIVDYLLSCRVMGRQVEEALVYLAVQSARRFGAKKLEARLVPTAKNKPCASFWQRSGFDNPDLDVFTWDLARPYPMPSAISIKYEDHGSLRKVEANAG